MVTMTMMRAIGEARDVRDGLERWMNDYPDQLDGLRVLGREYGAVVRAIESGRRGAFGCNDVAAVTFEARRVLEMWTDAAKRFGWAKASGVVRNG